MTDTQVTDRCVRLEMFANAIRSALRPYDLVGANDVSGRTTNEVVQEVIDAVASLDAWEAEHSDRVPTDQGKLDTLWRIMERVTDPADPAHKYGWDGRDRIHPIGMPGIIREEMSKHRAEGSSR